MSNQDKLYIIEDDATIVTLLKQHFSGHYQVFSVTNFRDIKQEVETIQPDMILMDITLPFFNGFYWTSEIRKSLTIPIIFISSSSDDMDAVMALNMGGDDFISKPFSINVLEAKISAFLRRSKQFSQEKLSFAGYELLADGNLVSEKNDSVALSPTEVKMMRILMTNNQKVIAKEDFLEKLWHDDSFIDHNTLNVNMTRLRKKLKTIGFNHLHTARGVGYFLK